MKIIVSSIREEGGMGMYEQNLVLPARGTLFRGSSRKFFVVCIPWMWALISIFQASSVASSTLRSLSPPTPFLSFLLLPLPISHLDLLSLPSFSFPLLYLSLPSSSISHL